MAAALFVALEQHRSSSSGEERQQIQETMNTSNWKNAARKEELQ